MPQCRSDVFTSVPVTRREQTVDAEGDRQQRIAVVQATRNERVDYCLNCFC